jgi:hypothetical protein
MRAQGGKEESMNNNGKQKITAIVRFDHSAIAIGRHFGRHEFVSLEALKKFAECRGYEISITHAHPAGVAIKREHEREATISILRSICVGMK